MKGSTAFELFSAPLLMIAIAMNQVRMAHDHALSPWKGGGFGMFSTVDGPGNRRLACEGVDSSGRSFVIDLAGSRELSGLSTRACTYPTPRVLRALAERLLATPMVAIGATQAELAERLTRDNPDIDVGRVAIETPFDVLRPRVDGDGAAGAPLATVALARVELSVQRVVWDPRAATVRFVPIGEALAALPQPAGAPAAARAGATARAGEGEAS